MKKREGSKNMVMKSLQARFHWYKIHVEIAHRRNSTKIVGIQACDETGRGFIFALPANFLLVKCSSFGSERPKLSFREVVYMLVPRYYRLGDYYVSIYCAG